jgi:hypothetical protein
VEAVRRGIERRTRDDEPSLPSGEEASGSDTEWSELLDDAIFSERRALSVLAANEVTARADLLRSENKSLLKGLPRIAMLSGGAGAFTLAAVGRFEEQALIYALASFVVGFLTSSSTSLLLRRGRRAVTEFAGLAEALSRQVSARFSGSLAD